MQAEFFARNRERFMDTLEGGVSVISAYTKMQRGNDVAATFEQESNFWWLTGIREPDWWLVVDAKKRESWLVAPEISITRQVFDGALSPNEATAISGIRKIFSQSDADRELRHLAGKHSIVYLLGEHPYVKYFDFHSNPAPQKREAYAKRIFSSSRDCRKKIARLRAIKQPDEIKALKQAIKTTVDAFAHVRELLPTLTYEYEIEAEFNYIFRKKGAEGHAYDPIIAGGKHSCTMHYDTNNDRLPKKGVVLMDVGARCSGYAADITRTYALGKPDARTKAVHDAVQSAQKEIISLLKPGLRVDIYQSHVDTIMKKKMHELGLLADMHDESVYRKYFPTAIGHGLGVDVHDVMGGWETFEAGMVVTVEPGIYINEESIGVRIEDDILITETGSENLSRRLSTDLI